MRLLSFGSGSSGNAFLIDTGEARIMFDCGVGIRRLRREMSDFGVAGTLDAVFITHEHIDHVRALQSLLRYESPQVYASEGTLDAIGRKPGWTAIRAETRVDVAGLEIRPIDVLHDAAEPLGFFIDAGNQRIALFTDLGAAAQTVASAIAEATIVVLESNYCEAMLRRSPYSAHLKRRIRSQHGHLSNDDCAATLVEALTPAGRTVWLAHLSENNNAPDVAEAAVQEAFSVRGIGLPVKALPRFETIDLFSLSRETTTWQSQLLS